MKARYPARLVAEDVAKFLGFQAHEIPLLVRAKLLKPLSQPSQRCAKHFSMVEIIAKRRNVAWMNKATEVICQYWRQGGEDQGS